MEPRVLHIFSFGRGLEKADDDLFRSSRVTAHAKHDVKMVDGAVDLLGPNIEILTDILIELGIEHTRFGVQASFYPPVGQALIATLEELLGDKFTSDLKNSWFECYQAMSYDMMRAIQNELMITSNNLI
jgi:hemoglobin-like flavoprotein